LLHAAGAAYPFGVTDVKLSGTPLTSFTSPRFDDVTVDLTRTHAAALALGAAAQPAPLGASTLTDAAHLHELLNAGTLTTASDAALSSYFSASNSAASNHVPSVVDIDLVEIFARHHGQAGTSLLRMGARLLELADQPGSSIDPGVLRASARVFLNARLPDVYAQPACWPDLVRLANAAGVPVESIEVQTATGAVALTSLAGFP
jgi:hypothetical protein